MSQQVNVYRELAIKPGAIVTGWMPNPPTTDYYVDATNGADTNSGNGWGASNSYATIGKAMTMAAALATRGRWRCFVAPAWYTEDVKTPLNSTSPFGQLIAVNPTPGQSYGAAGGTAYTAGVEVIEVRGRGTYVSGFEFDALDAAECMVLGGSTANSNASGVIIEDCLFVGQNQGSCGIDMNNVTTSNALQTIRSCGFYGFHVSGTTASCIKCSNSGEDQPRFTLIEHCWFGDSDNLLMMNPRGFKESTIRYCTFLEVGANYTATKIIDNTGGNGLLLYANKFSGTYGTGNYVAASNDEWAGNYVDYTATTAPYGLTMKDPA